MIQRARRKRMIEKSGSKVKLGMMRHMFIVIDMSECMKLQVSPGWLVGGNLLRFYPKAILGYE